MESLKVVLEIWGNKVPDNYRVEGTTVLSEVEGHDKIIGKVWSVEGLISSEEVRKALGLLHPSYSHFGSLMDSCSVIQPEYRHMGSITGSWGREYKDDEPRVPRWNGRFMEAVPESQAKPIDWWDNIGHPPSDMLTLNISEETLSEFRESSKKIRAIVAGMDNMGIAAGLAGEKLRECSIVPMDSVPHSHHIHQDELLDELEKIPTHYHIDYPSKPNFQHGKLSEQKKYREGNNRKRKKRK